MRVRRFRCAQLFRRLASRNSARLLRRAWQTTLLLSASLVVAPADATTFSVINGNDSGAGSLRQAILDANAAGGTNLIQIDPAVGTISLTQNLPVIDASFTIAGNHATLQGNNHRLFFVDSGTVALQDLTISSGLAQGGSGGSGLDPGGGGLGAGGALFVNAGAHVSVQGVAFNNNNATGGGAGGYTTILASGGGGGGFGGNGGTSFDGGNVGGSGGGGGLITSGGVGGNGGGAGGGGGGVTGNGVNNGGDFGGAGSGGAAGGNSSGSNGQSGTPGGGGGGFNRSANVGGSGGNGVLYGGGGGAGAYAGHGGNGGDFAGGGGAFNAAGGSGGFGGGGGGALSSPGAGGFGGGAGARGTTAGATGGSGFGGAVFVRQGGTLTVFDSSATGNSVIAGAAGHGRIAAGTTGSAAGQDLYLMTGVNATFDGTGSGTFNGSIAGAGGLLKQGSGTLTLNGANAYSGGTTVSAGSLTGTTGSLQGNITNNANVNFDQASNGTYAGTLTGSGSLTKSGAGNVTLSGSNNYSGGTTVAAGTLTGTTGSLQGDINDNATLTFNQASGGTFAGNIFGVGGVVKLGPAAVTFTGNNNYSGGTTVSGGSLVGSAASLPGDIVNNANVTFNQGTDAAYDGAVSGSGSLTKTGAGNLTLNGNNSYAGGTTVSAGTLTGTSGTLQGDIVNNAALVFDQDTNGTYGGSISGSGSLNKTGTGNLIVSGSNLFSGTTTVQDGRLSVNGSLSGPVNVGQSGELGGNGTINNTVDVSGTIAPGNSIGTLTVGGLTTQAGSTVQVQINDTGASDLLIVNGNVTLNGGTVDVQAAPGNYHAGMQYNFLTYTGTRSGTFAGIVDDLPLLDAELIYGSGVIGFDLIRSATSYVSLAQTFNQVQAATYLDAHSVGAGGDLGTFYDQLNLQSAAGARSALQQVGGQVYGTIAQLGVQNSTQVYLLLNRRLGPDSGSLGGGAAGGGYASAQPAGGALSFDPSTPSSPIVRANNGRDWSGFVSGYGLGGNVQGDGNAGGANYGIGGTVFAAQKRLDDHHGWGFFGNYSGLNLSVVGPRQTSTANDFQMGNYLRGDDGFNYYVVAGSVGTDSYRSTRQITLGALNRSAVGDYGGWQASTWLERGVTFRRAGWELQPFAALQYIYVRQNSFSETGAGALNLNVAGINTNALRNVLGLYASRPFATRSGQLIRPALRALWLHEYLNPETSLNARLGGLGGSSFATRGLNFGRDWAVLGGGLNWQASDRWSLFANYDLQFNAVQTFHVGSGGAQFSW